MSWTWEEAGEPAQRQWELADSTQRGPGRKTNPEPSCCVETVLTTALPCCPSAGTNISNSEIREIRLMTGWLHHTGSLKFFEVKVVVNYITLCTSAVIQVTSKWKEKAKFYGSNKIILNTLSDKPACMPIRILNIYNPSIHYLTLIRDEVAGAET